MADPVLSSEMSYAAILATFQDYSDYDLLASPARARIYIKAGRMLLALSIRRSGQANRLEEVELEPEILERSVNAAVTWLRTYNEANALPTQYIVSSDWRD
jgi:hypothetical protein